MIERIKSAMVGLGASWVLWLMFGLSVISLAIMLERAWLFWSLRDDVNALMRDLGRLLRGGDVAGARARLEQSPSAEAAVVVAGVVEAEANRGPQAAEEAMAGAAALQRVKLEKRLTYLGTLGNNAPFIGLLGTVIGIVGAFEEFGKGPGQAVAGAASSGPSEAVMRNIAEALVTTAVGLVVAIPAVAAFNTFQRIIKTTLSNTDALGHVLLAHLKSDDVRGGVDESAVDTREPRGGRERPLPAAVTPSPSRASAITKGPLKGPSKSPSKASVAKPVATAIDAPLEAPSDPDATDESV